MDIIYLIISFILFFGFIKLLQRMIYSFLIFERCHFCKSKNVKVKYSKRNIGFAQQDIVTIKCNNCDKKDVQILNSIRYFDEN